MGAAAVGSAAALSAACAPAAPSAATLAAPPTAGPTVAPTVAPTAAPTVAQTVAPTAVATLKIGVLVPYTESSIGVDIGLNQKRAADLYLKQQGGKLGGRAVNLVYSAESVEPGINKVKVKTLTDKESVEVLMGGASADTAYVMRDAAEAAKLVYVDTNAFANSLTRAIPDCKPSCKSKYLFRTSASAWQLSEPLGESAAKSSNGAFFVAFVDDTFGAESADAFVAGLEKNGGKAADRMAFPNGGDWAKVVSAIKSQPARNVYAAFHTDDAEGFIAAWSAAGMSAAGFKLFGPGVLTEREVLNQAKNATVGIVTSHFWSAELDNAANKALVAAFPVEYKDDETGEPVQLSGYAVEMWDAMAALDAALKSTNGSATSDALIAALEGVTLKSPRGAVAFDKATHNLIQDILIREVKLNAAGAPINAIVDKFPRVTDPGA